MIKKYTQKGLAWAKTHKLLAGIILLVIIGGIYGITKAFSGDATETKYVLAQVERGSVISTISGTGQVSASDKIDITAKASGDLVYLNAIAGQAVFSGALLGQINTKDAAYDLETALLSYEELMTIDAKSLRNAENAVTNAETNLEDAYVNAHSTLTTASTNMADTTSEMKELFNRYLNNVNFYTTNRTTQDYVTRAEYSYYKAADALSLLTKEHRELSPTPTREEIENLINDSYEVAISVAQAVKYTQDAIVFKRDREEKDTTIADEAYTTVTRLVSSANSLVSNLSSTRTALNNGKRALSEANNDLQDLKAGPDALDIRAKELSLRQKQEALADFYIRAPFDGILASVAVKKGNSINNGTLIATLITKDKVAEISLNEIDAAKVAVGQKTTLTFDAVEDLMISGEVIEVDLVGSVSQGVVNYAVKIGFDTDDERVKPGMTVSANIITEMKQDVLAVPASAVKIQGDISYVEIATRGNSQEALGASGISLSSSPTRAEVKIGLSGDEMVEIVSGLEEGQTYIARTITSGNNQSASGSNFFGGNNPRSTRGGGFGGGGSFPR